MRSNAYKLFLNFKMALYSSALVMEHLTVVERCFKPKYYSKVEGWPSFKCITTHSPTHLYN